MSKYLTQSIPASFNGDMSVFRGFFERGMTREKANTLDGYLELIGDYFDRLEVYPTVGYGRRPYPFQWFAYSKLFAGYDDTYEGKGSTPLEAVRNLYHAIGADYPAEGIDLESEK